MVNLLFYIYFILLLFSLARRGRPPLFAPRLPWGREVLSRPGMLQPQPRDAETLFLFLQPPERRETPALQQELGKRVPTAACGEPSIKRVTPAPLCVRKEGEGGGEKQGKKKKKLSKQTLGSHGYCQRSREVKRSREQHKGRGRTAASPFPSRPFCPLRPASSRRLGAGPVPGGLPVPPGPDPGSRSSAAVGGLVPLGKKCPHVPHAAAHRRQPPWIES